MKRACCDWAAVNQGRPADRRTRARSCPKHLRGRTVHVRPVTSKVRPVVARAAQEAVVRATWARWAASLPGAIQ